MGGGHETGNNAAFQTGSKWKKALNSAAQNQPSHDRQHSAKFNPLLLSVIVFQSES